LLETVDIGGMRDGVHDWSLMRKSARILA